MSLEKICQISGTCLPVAGADIDTDRIIPARFLKCITFNDLAGKMFWDERFDTEGKSKNHPIDNPRYAGSTILISGPNFGCGSSREHAPQTIRRSGIKAIIAESFAEIFFGNSAGIGLPCLAASASDLSKLFAAVTEDPTIEISIDLENLTATWNGNSFPISIPESARQPLIKGEWDAISGLLANKEQILALEKTLPSRK